MFRDGWKFSWWRALVGALMGCLCGYINYAKSGIALWWLAIPVLAIAVGWYNEFDEDDERNPWY